MLTRDKNTYHTHRMGPDATELYQVVHLAQITAVAALRPASDRGVPRSTQDRPRLE